MFREEGDRFLPVFLLPMKDRPNATRRLREGNSLLDWKAPTRGVLQMLLSFLAMVCAQFFEPLRELLLCLRRKQWRLVETGLLEGSESKRKARETCRWSFRIISSICSSAGK